MISRKKLWVKSGNLDSLPPPAASLQAASPVPPLLLLAPALQQCGGTETRSEAPPGGRDGVVPQAGLVLLPLLPQQAAHH